MHDECGGADTLKNVDGRMSLCYEAVDNLSEL